MPCVYVVGVDGLPNFAAKVVVYRLFYSRFYLAYQCHLSARSFVFFFFFCFFFYFVFLFFVCFFYRLF